MLSYQLPPALDEDIRRFEEDIQAFKDGRLHETAFVARRVRMGVYMERGNRTFMGRIRCAGNIITPAQLQKAAELAQSYGQPRVHVTSRAEIQIHGVNLEDTPVIMRALAEVGLSMKGGGGHTIRNIITNQDSGVHPDDVFDVQPDALALTGRLLAEADSFNLPRKFKICLSSLNHDAANCTLHDLGFVAARNGSGVPGYTVYCGGGLGVQPQKGIVLEEFIPRDKLFHVARAVKNVFQAHGNRRSKHHSRIRFLIHADMGIDRFRAYYRRELDRIYDDRRLDLNAVPVDNAENLNRSIALTPFEGQDPAFSVWRRRHVKGQRQQGLYQIRMPLLLGDLSSRDSLRLAAVLRPLGDNVLRCGADQNLYLRNIPERYLSLVHHQLRALQTLMDKPPLYATIMPCTGAQTCQLGINYPRPAVEAVFAHLAHMDLDLDDLGEVNIRISGCPNGCANHWSADLGFYGKVRRVKGRPVPTYNVVGGGGVSSGDARLAEQAGWVHARDLPQFLGQVLERYAAFKTAAAEPTDFGRFWRSEGRAYIADLCADRYNHIPAFEENRQYYYDHGSTEIFSTRNISGQAECSAGIYDMIAVDEKAVRSNLDQIAAWSGQPSALDAMLRETVFFTTRMLLVTRGEEAITEGETYALFIKHFIDRRLIADTHRSVVQQALDPKAALTPHADAVAALAEAILELYSRMDDTMRFPGEGQPAERAESKEVPATGTGSQRRREPDRFKDLRGVKCPINFAQTKIQLAAMQSGQILEIYLDDGEPIKNVPGSVKLEGHDVIEQQKVDEFWSVVIRKA